MEKYSPENYAAMEIGEYRTKFPSETERFTDEQLYDAVAATDDDMHDVEWKTYFIEYKLPTAQAAE